MNTPVNFETAKLLKEKGLHLKVRSMYCEGKLLKDTNSKGNYNDVIWVRTWRNSPTDDTVSAPTIAEVVMWLYEKHDIWINVSMENNEEDKISFYYTILHNDKGETTFKNRISDFNSPTEAYEAAISYTLKNLI